MAYRGGAGELIDFALLQRGAEVMAEAVGALNRRLPRRFDCVRERRREAAETLPEDSARARLKWRDRTLRDLAHDEALKRPGYEHPAQACGRHTDSTATAVRRCSSRHGEDGSQWPSEPHPHHVRRRSDGSKACTRCR